MKTYPARRDAGGLRFAIVVSRFNHLICARLLEGCVRELRARGAASDALHVAWVPGAYEIPQAARTLATSGRYDAVVTLGVVIRGGTPHFEYVASEVNKGIARLSLDLGIPVIQGIITSDNLEQAIERAGAKEGNRGFAAANGAIEMANLIKSFGA